jgi:serine/threonine-protein kinase
VNSNSTVDHPEPAPATADQTVDHHSMVDPNTTVDHPKPSPEGTVSHVASSEAIRSSKAGRPKRGRELPTVPGYEILSELGRGGMGVVYRARQTRLNRLVALKMVLAGAHASPQQLARFDQEARSVARLQHPNIVQIYEIGEQEGLPYFSLEFVDGGSLEQLIARNPQPPRLAAELVETLARAMHFAHEQNIIHRDLKPANVLLTRSAPRATGSVSLEPGGRSTLSSPGKSVEGGVALGPLTPKITDFGLAKAVEEGGSQNTASGTILGTPSYMAPEQARGQVSGLGPLCDLYSLGAILYELLTGRPPFQGATLLDTLDQVRRREPVPVHELQPKVPTDLETICLKCLQKEPAKRYANCGELADDLARFLAGHPIQARPVSGAERLWRWCRRNPWVAGLSAASVLFLVCTAAVSLWAAVAMAAKNRVIGEEKAAAIKSAEEAEEARKAAVAAEKVAAENSQLAGEQAAVALTTLQRLISKVQEDTGLEATPETIEFKRYMMQTALEGAQQVSKRGEGSTSLAATQAAAHMQLGQMFRQLGKSKEALAQFRKVYEIAKARVVLKKGTDASRRNLALALVNLADMEKEIGRNMQAALAQNQEALALWEDIDRHPKADENGLGLTKKEDVKAGMAEVNTRVGVTYGRLGDPARGTPYFRKALAIRRQRSQQEPGNLGLRLDLARSLLAVGDNGFRVEDTATSVASFNECLGIVEDVFRQKPKILAVKQELARACSLKGDYHLRVGENEVARTLFERALALTKELVAADAKKFDYQWDLANAHYRLGLLALRTKDAEGARAQFESCRAVREKLAAQDPGNDRRRMELMLALSHCGKHAEAAAIAMKFLGGVTDGELLIDVTRCYAQCAAGVPGDDGLRQRYTQEALRALDKALKQGYRDVVYLNTEVDLDPLRTQEGFGRLLEVIRQSADHPPALGRS